MATCQIGIKGITNVDAQRTRIDQPPFASFVVVVGAMQLLVANRGVRSLSAQIPRSVRGLSARKQRDQGNNPKAFALLCSEVGEKKSGDISASSVRRHDECGTLTLVNGKGHPHLSVCGRIDI